MPRKPRQTITEVLRQALAKAGPINAVANATGLEKGSLLRFLRGEQSLRLDKADILGNYLGITITIEPRKASISPEKTARSRSLPG